jgi:hypothetical protein
MDPDPSRSDGDCWLLVFHRAPSDLILQDQIDDAPLREERVLNMSMVVPPRHATAFAGRPQPCQGLSRDRLTDSGKLTTRESCQILK